MSMSAKLNILTNEGCRRLRNCSPNLPWAEQVTYLNKLMISMLYGGYSGKTTQIVARRVIAKYTNNMYNYREEGRPLYRSKSQRALVQKPDKATWFRNTGATATLTVPHTPNSELSRMLRIKVMDTGPKGTKVLVMESSVPPIMLGIA